jgi:tetratricopeptide (TPR) repeat protein
MTDVWSQYAMALTRLQRFEDALDAYARVIRLQPDEPNGPLGAASVLLTLNRLNDARAHAQLAVGRAPGPAHQALALIEVAARRDAEALRHAELAAAAEPGLPMPAFVRGTLAYNAQRYDEALRALTDARAGYARRSTQPRDLNFMIGDALARLERYKEAEPFLREEARLYPEHVRARASLAMLYQSTGREALAGETLDALVREVPSLEAYDTTARVWRMFGRADRAAAVDADARRAKRPAPRGRGPR